MSPSLILQEKNAGICTLTIQRPEALNALNAAVIRALAEAVQSAQSDPEVRVILLTGSGEKAFVAGADIKEFADFDAEQGRHLADYGQELLFNRIERSGTPIIAAINGFALGGGLELALACHMRVASDSARMGFPEVSLGVIPGYGGTQRLPQVVGKGKAMEMILTARMVGAEEALQCGLVNAVVPASELLDAAQKMAQRILKNSPMAVDMSIQAILAGYEDGVNGFKAEIECFGASFATEDFKEGTQAFIAKRKPDFPGK
ncbi:MAG: enoyl-CoA hydratase-related protein [Bacteroidetes bacterium]|jgi:enoyl-CoA hydratase|nr:enoyl-CoA hydratase-related protein [Bacteroidota bacterium]